MKTNSMNKAQAAGAQVAQHTPGPWHISRTARGHVRMIRCERTLPGAIEGLAVAKIVHAVGFDEEHANARLIAAAPELLEALQAALPLLEADAIQAVAQARPNTGEADGAMALIDQARAAIAKAEGKL